MRRLSLKQKKFVEEYIKDGNGAKSAEKAGYGIKKTDNYLARVASENVRKCSIQAEINKRLAKIEEKTDFTVEFIRQEMLNLLDNAKTKQDLTNVKGALELMAKHKAMLTDVQRAEPVEREQLTPEEKAEVRLAAKRALDIKIAKTGS